MRWGRAALLGLAALGVASGTRAAPFEDPAARTRVTTLENGLTILTLVLDHNWPSRRTAEKLGATVCANYVTYRRRFARR